MTDNGHRRKLTGSHLTGSNSRGAQRGLSFAAPKVGANTEGPPTGSDRSNPNQHDASSFQEATGLQENQENPVLKKIRETLANTPATSWREYGEPFDSEKRYRQPLPTIEHLFALTKGDNQLVMRCSQPVQGVFALGGYALAAISEPRYFIELYPLNYDVRQVAEPYRRTNKQVILPQALTDGEVAERLFNELKIQVYQAVRETRAKFDAEFEEILSRLPDMVEKLPASTWDKQQDTANNFLRFAIKTNTSIVIEICGTISGEENWSGILLTNESGYRRGYEGSRAKTLFNTLREKSQDLGLQTLDKLLSGMGK